MRLALLPSLPLGTPVGAPEADGAPAVTAPGGGTGISEPTPYQPPWTQGQGTLSSVRLNGVVGQ